MLGQSILHFKFWERKPCPSQCTDALLFLRFWSPKTCGTCGTEWERDLLGGVAEGSGLQVAAQGTYWHLPSLLKSVSSLGRKPSSQGRTGQSMQMGHHCGMESVSALLSEARSLPRSGQRIYPWEEGWVKWIRLGEAIRAGLLSWGTRAFYSDSLERGPITAPARSGGLALNPQQAGMFKDIWGTNAHFEGMTYSWFSCVFLLMYDLTPFSVIKES